MKKLPEEGQRVLLWLRNGEVAFGRRLLDNCWSVASDELTTSVKHVRGEDVFSWAFPPSRKPQDLPENTLLRSMRSAREEVYWLFFHRGFGTKIHAFLEFNGLLGKYVDMCERAHAQGVDFTDCNKHSGNVLPMEEHDAVYLGEKFDCIFGPSLRANPAVLRAFLEAIVPAPERPASIFDALVMTAEGGFASVDAEPAPAPSEGEKTSDVVPFVECGVCGEELVSEERDIEIMTRGTVHATRGFHRACARDVSNAVRAADDEHSFHHVVACGPCKAPSCKFRVFFCDGCRRECVVTAMPNGALVAPPGWAQLAMEAMVDFERFVCPRCIERSEAEAG